MNEQTHSQVTIGASRFPRISWGAVFAGLVIVLSLSWLMHMLGAAIGVGLADAYDSATIEGGLDESVAFWTIASWAIAFFIGALVSARLAGSIDDFAGMLHGLTLWGVATIVAVVVGYAGVSSLLRTGQNALSVAVQAVGTTVSSTVEGAQTAAYQVGTTAQQALDTQLAEDLQNRLADRAVEMTAELDEELSEQDIRQAIEEVDQRTIRRMAQDLINEDTEGAAQLLADTTELSQEDARALVDGVYRQLEETLGDPEDSESLRQDLQDQLAGQVDSYVAQLDEQGGPQTTARDVRRAVAQLDNEALAALAREVADGDPTGAKRVLARNTNLSQAQIEDLYQGASEGWQTRLEEYAQAANKMAESVVNYSQAVLWLIFGASAIALLVSLLGGWLGATSSRDAYGVAH